MLNINLNYKTVIVTALVGAAAVWVAKKGIQGVAQALDPTDPENVANSFVNRVYSYMTGSKDTPGEDIADATAGAWQDEIIYTKEGPVRAGDVGRYTN